MSRKAQIFVQFADGKTPGEVDPLGLKAGTIRKYYSEWDKRGDDSGRRQIDHLIPQINQAVSAIAENQQATEVNLGKVEVALGALSASNEKTVNLFGDEIEKLDDKIADLSKAMSLLEGKFCGQQKLLYALMLLTGGALTWLIQIAFKISPF